MDAHGPPVLKAGHASRYLVIVCFSYISIWLQVFVFFVYYYYIMFACLECEYEYLFSLASVLCTYIPLQVSWSEES